MRRDCTPLGYIQRCSSNRSATMKWCWLLVYSGTSINQSKKGGIVLHRRRGNFVVYIPQNINFHPIIRSGASSGYISTTPRATLRDRNGKNEDSKQHLFFSKRLRYAKHVPRLTLLLPECPIPRSRAVSLPPRSPQDSRPCPGHSTLPGSPRLRPSPASSACRSACRSPRCVRADLRTSPAPGARHQ
jgi:hypothetical protein